MEFKDLTLKELTDVIAGLGKPAYAAKNMFKWVYKRRMEDFSQMSDIAKGLRTHFADNYKISGLKIVETETINNTNL